MTLRAWMRRIASKVTVVFDGAADLRENVKIYISRTLKIYDTCLVDAPSDSARDASMSKSTTGDTTTP